MPRRGSQISQFMYDGLMTFKWYPNVVWVAEELGIFAIQNTHQRNQNYSTEGSQIYKDYHILKKPGYPFPKLSVMKNKFYAAMNSKEVRCIRKLTADEIRWLEDGHKVKSGKKHRFYQFLNSFDGGSSGNDNPSSVSSSSTYDDEAEAAARENESSSPESNTGENCSQRDIDFLQLERKESASPGYENLPLEFATLMDVDNFNNNEVLHMYSEEENIESTSCTECFKKGENEMLGIH